MLSSTKRRILNIICVSLAIVAMGIGLTMKYAEPINAPLEMSDFSESDRFELVADRDSLEQLPSFAESTDPN